jgi:tRNA threonylcarbamoyladenosine biosynthesis protein TsaE
MAQGLELDCRVSSPTFTIVNEYLGARELIHFDMYRLSSADELFDIGWEDYIARGAICAVEWSENVEDAFYGDEIIVSIHKLSDNERKITIEGVELC